MSSTPSQELDRHLQQPPALSSYTDYRQFLRDFYLYKRACHRHDLRPYTYAMFSAAANIKSPNYLKLIIDGRRNLSEPMMGRFAKALQLNKEETEELRALVRYNQETEPIKRNQFLKALSDLRVRRQIQNGGIDTKTWDKIPNWIAWVLQAMVEQKGLQFDPVRLQNVFCSRVSTADIEAALSKLLESGELSRDPQTLQAKRERKLIESPENVPIEMVRKLQAELIYLGLESLFRDEAPEREFGALTLALTEEEFEQIRFELRQLRKRLNRDIAAKRESGPGERVYQLNIQFFPMTRDISKESV